MAISLATLRALARKSLKDPRVTSWHDKSLGYHVQVHTGYEVIVSVGGRSSAEACAMAAAALAVRGSRA